MFICHVDRVLNPDIMTFWLFQNDDLLWNSNSSIQRIWKIDMSITVYLKSLAFNDTTLRSPSERIKYQTCQHWNFLYQISFTYPVNISSRCKYACDSEEYSINWSVNDRFRIIRNGENIRTFVYLKKIPVCFAFLFPRVGLYSVYVSFLVLMFAVSMLVSSCWCLQCIC